jgi:pyruvate dehydrogenase E1 component alpha subunit
VPVGAGLGFAHKYRGDGGIALALYGDGAANQGQIFEAFNMAGLWSLPVLFVCENNHYGRGGEGGFLFVGRWGRFSRRFFFAPLSRPLSPHTTLPPPGMGTAEWRGSKSSDFYTRGDYTPGLKIDGMDVLAVKHGVAFAKAYAVEHGPIVLEMDTYRYHGHSMSDPGSTYRTRDEVSGVRQARDPVEAVRKLLLERAGVDAGELKKIEKAIKAEVDAAVEAAKGDPVPGMDWLARNVYRAPLGAKARGVDSASSFPLSVSV